MVLPRVETRSKAEQQRRENQVCPRNPPTWTIKTTKVRINDCQSDSRSNELLTCEQTGYSNYSVGNSLLKTSNNPDRQVSNLSTSVDNECENVSLFNEINSYSLTSDDMCRENVSGLNCPDSKGMGGGGGWREVGESHEC